MRWGGLSQQGEEVRGGRTLPGDTLRARRPRVPPSDSTLPSRSAPLPRGQSPGRGVSRQPVLPLFYSSERTEPQREPRLSPGSLSPRALAQPVSNRRLRLLSFFFFLLFFSFPLLPLSRLVTRLRPIAATPAGAGWLLIGPLGARSRLPLLGWSKADKRRRLRAPATRLSQSPSTSLSLPPPLLPARLSLPARLACSRH